MSGKACTIPVGGKLQYSNEKKLKKKTNQTYGEIYHFLDKETHCYQDTSTSQLDLWIHSPKQSHSKLFCGHKQTDFNVCIDLGKDLEWPMRHQRRMKLEG